MTDTHDELNDELLAALDELVAALEDRSTVEQALERAAYLRRRVTEGARFRALLADQERPLLVELVSERLEHIAIAGARFRRAEALGLYSEGMTMDAIAQAFGVTRQRISAILRDAREQTGAP